MKQKRALITGANGLIGKELITLLSSNFEIYALVHSTPQNKNPKVNYIVCDLSTNWEVSILPADINYIIHLAQSEKFREFPDTATEVFNVNTYSTIKLLAYAKYNDIEKFIYASSGGVYGNSDRGFNESSPINLVQDLGFYLSTKYMSEILLGNYTQYFDVNILRFFFVYGPSQKKNMLIPRLFSSIENSLDVVLQGKDGVKINPIYVSDAAASILEVMNRPGSYNLNVGGKEIVTIKDLAKLIGKVVGKDPVFKYESGDVKNVIGDITALKKIRSPRINLNQGLNFMKRL